LKINRIHTDNINYIIVFLVCFYTVSCNKTVKVPEQVKSITLVNQKIKYASGFTIKNHKTYKEIAIVSPWPNAKTEHRYILYPKGTPKPDIPGTAKFITIPVNKTIVTSTTDIPVLEHLNLENKLIGFPNTDYISSKKTRALIDKGAITDLGNEKSINTELVLELDPEIMIGFSADGNTKNYDLIEKSGIPVVINSSWMEPHPLGRAEWIKFIAAFYAKEIEADTIFNRIEKKYNKAAQLAKKNTTPPTILSGNMYKDIWYVPGGNSYFAQFLKDANTNYLWAEIKKTGSIPLSFESVLEKGQQAELWIGSENSA